MDRWRRRFNDGPKPSRGRSHKPEAAAKISAGDVGAMFQGGRIDPVAGLVDFRCRDMHPGVMPWLDKSRTPSLPDPLALPG